MSSSKSQGESAHKKPTVNTQPIAEINVKPRQRLPLLLGNFTADKSPVGFAIELNSDPAIETFVSQVVVLPTTSGNKFVSYLTNSGKKTVSAKIFQL